MSLWKPLFLILFMPDQYIAVGGNGARHHGSVFRTDFKRALYWVTLALVLGLFFLLALGRLRLDANIDWPKLFAGVAAALGGLATWFALATPEDTWDREGRLDTALRGFLFKVLLFPGILLGIVATSW